MRNEIREILKIRGQRFADVVAPIGGQLCRV